MVINVIIMKFLNLVFFKILNNLNKKNIVNINKIFGSIFINGLINVILSFIGFIVVCIRFIILNVSFGI